MTYIGMRKLWYAINRPLSRDQDDYQGYGRDHLGNGRCPWHARYVPDCLETRSPKCPVDVRLFTTDLLALLAHYKDHHEDWFALSDYLTEHGYTK